MRSLKLPVLIGLLLSACASQPAPGWDRVELWQGTLTPRDAAPRSWWRLQMRESSDGYFGQAYQLNGADMTLVGPVLFHAYDGKMLATVNLQRGQHRMVLSRDGNVLAGSWEQTGTDGSTELAGQAHFELVDLHDEVHH